MSQLCDSRLNIAAIGLIWKNELFATFPRSESKNQSISIPTMAILLKQFISPFSVNQVLGFFLIFLHILRVVQHYYIWIKQSLINNFYLWGCGREKGQQANVQIWENGCWRLHFVRAPQSEVLHFCSLFHLTEWSLKYISTLRKQKSIRFYPGISNFAFMEEWFILLPPTLSINT